MGVGSGTDEILGRVGRVVVRGGEDKVDGGADGEVRCEGAGIGS